MTETSERTPVSEESRFMEYLKKKLFEDGNYVSQADLNRHRLDSKESARRHQVTPRDRRENKNLDIAIQRDLILLIRQFRILSRIRNTCWENIMELRLTMGLWNWIAGNTVPSLTRRIQESGYHMRRPVTCERRMKELKNLLRGEEEND